MDQLNFETFDFDSCIEMAKLAEQAERFDDMKEAMKCAVKCANSELKPDNRNLLSVAFKNVVGTRRTAWRVILSIESKANSDNKPLLNDYKRTIRSELQEHCMEIITLLDEKILNNDAYSNSPEAEVFFLKMKGDYYRYITEVFDGDHEDEKADKVKKANEAYSKAKDIAVDKLDAIDPIRLGLALNYSVFHYEIMEDPSSACDLAKQAFDEAISQLDSSNEDTYKDSALILQLLRDNLTLWTADKDD